MSTMKVDADSSKGAVVATVELKAKPERVFHALASPEITKWWVRPGVFDTREWSGDVRAGGHWHASGVGQGRPYTLDGEFIEVDAPRKLVHTWQLNSPDGPVSTATYRLEPVAGGTRLSFEHGSFGSSQAVEANRAGWETSFKELVELLSE
jgi:uncharacterized protein YndB with AHSA1/START domain